MARIETLIDGCTVGSKVQVAVVHVYEAWVALNIAVTAYRIGNSGPVALVLPEEIVRNFHCGVGRMFDDGRTRKGHNVVDDLYLAVAADFDTTRQTKDGIIPEQ